MALHKPTIIPGYGASAYYFRIDTIDRLCQIRKEAQFRVYAYKDQATAAMVDGKGYYHGGVIEVKSPVFDLYFSRAALGATDHSVHGQAYQLVKDYNAAMAIPEESRTDNQKLLTVYGAVRIANDLGGAAFFADAADC